MHVEDFRQVMELDTWYGPNFDRADLDDINMVGVTVIARDRPSVRDMTARIDRTEFIWKSDRASGIKTFEAEELRSSDAEIESYIVNRYVHAERDTNVHVFRHFDGAAKVYLPADYGKRLESNLPRIPRAHMKPKLFRIDGDIDVDEWLLMTSMFFKDNENGHPVLRPEKIR